MTSRRVAAFMLFAVVVVAHFALSVAGHALALRVAFDPAPGGTARPLDVGLVRAAEILLAPLLVIRRVTPSVSVDSPEIAATSVAFGAAAVGALWLVHRRRGPRASSAGMRSVRRGRPRRRPRAECFRRVASSRYRDAVAIGPRRAATRRRI